MRARQLRALLLAGTVAMVLLLAGCGGGGLHPLDTAVAQSYVNLLREQRFNQIQNDMNLDLFYSVPRDQLVSMSGLFPSAPPLSIKIVGANIVSTPGFRSTALTLEYEFPHKWLLAGVTTQEANGRRTLTALNVTPIPDSLEHTNRFSLWDKTELEYDTLFLGLLSILFSLYAFVTCLSTNIRTAKWFWLAVTLIGIGGFQINWTTGDILLTPWVFRLPPLGGSAPVYGPAMVYVAIPLGALIFLAFRRRLTTRTPIHDELRDFEQAPAGLHLLWRRTPHPLRPVPGLAADNPRGSRH